MFLRRRQLGQWAEEIQFNAVLEHMPRNDSKAAPVLSMPALSHHSHHSSDFTPFGFNKRIFGFLTNTTVNKYLAHSSRGKLDFQSLTQTDANSAHR